MLTDMVLIVNKKWLKKKNKMFYLNEEEKQE